MSMVYDPLTREFRPRESRAPKPQPAEGAAVSEELPPKLPSEEGRKRRTRRWMDVRRHRRRRETLAWFLFILVAGSLIWVTAWMWGKSRHGVITTQDRPHINRFLQNSSE